MSKTNFINIDGTKTIFEPFVEVVSPLFIPRSIVFKVYVQIERRI